MKFKRIGLIFVVFILTTTSGYSKDESTNIKTNTTSIKCADGRLLFVGECRLIQEIQNIIGAEIEVIYDKKSTGMARTEQEVKETIGPLFDRYMKGDVAYEVQNIFADEIFNRSTELSPGGLRLLLDVRYYHDRYSKAIFAEISEGWRDGVIPYIEKETDLVVSIYKDKNQLNRELISDAFYQFIDQFGRDADGRITDKRFTDKYKELKMIISQEGI